MIFGSIVLFKPFGIGQNRSDTLSSESQMEHAAAQEYSDNDTTSKKSNDMQDETQTVTLPKDEALAMLSELVQDSIIECGENYAVIDASKAKEVLSKYKIDAQQDSIVINW